MTFNHVVRGSSPRWITIAPLAQLVEQLTLNQWVRGSSPRRCTSRKDRFSTCLFCWCTLRGRVRGTAVTLAIGKEKSAVVRIRVSEYCRGLPQAGNGKVSRRCKMSRCHKTCLFLLNAKCWGADYKISQYNIFGYQNLSVSRSIKVYVFWSFQSFYTLQNFNIITVRANISVFA